MSPPEEGTRIVVVGAGVGGLACALDLTFRGYSVTLLERSEQVGGKLRALSIADRAIDSGPTVMTMRWVFEELFAAGGTRLDEHLVLRPLEILARHSWPDGSRLDLFSDHERSAAAIAEFAGAPAADGYRRFCKYAERIYRTVEAPFIRSSRPRMSDVVRTLGWKGLRDFMQVDWQRSMWRALGDYFQDPRLRQLFGRYATYYGSSPFRCPATLNLIAHVEKIGVWRIEGGMVRLAHALEDLLVARGARIEKRTHVDRLEVAEGRVRAVHVGERRIEADAVVLNAPPSALRSGCFGDALRASVSGRGVTPRSLSAVTWSATVRTRGFPLDHHNVFFSGDYPLEFSELFDRETVPSDPTIYVCAQDRGGASEPDADERLLCLVNAPAIGDRQGAFPGDMLAELQSRTFASLERHGLHVDLDGGAHVRTTPVEFEQLFPATGGALYGGATHSSMTPFQRPEARTRVRGLYLAGGGAHPGAGVPMVALSGRIAAAAIAEDQGRR